MPRRRITALVLVGLAILWLPLNQPVEGPQLLRLSETHAVTTADLLSVALVLVAAWLWWSARRREGR
ncbi:hypothetical protein [Actinomycetospora sp. NBRC 106378]|uniref:hypothetical protein n=1 Tax=Actinomycetospora sp. NBRC 106378 TaxID=3032208 RepID=UPI0024A545CA|nr:hypothetical protein [Actinomycetospora sp. NBRC 106378]GLZ51813.1 hypothetical protein Acsp07_14300 [Actinomycetospora sp. NBRC 106378]